MYTYKIKKQIYILFKSHIGYNILLNFSILVNRYL